MIVILVKTTDAFRIDDKDADWLSFRVEAGEWRTPNPNTFRARVDRWSDTEASLPVEKHSVEQVALTRAVHARDGNDTDWSLDLIHHRDNIRVDNELCKTKQKI